MTRRISVPFLVDIIRVRSPEMMRAIADDTQLNRGFYPSGPLINRIIVGRARRVLSVKGKLLPSAALRGNEERATRQLELEKALDPDTSPPPWDEKLLRSLASYVRGGRGRPFEIGVQEIVGRLFVPDYQASGRTWDAARTLEAGLRSNNPLRRVYWAITRKIPRAQRTLSKAAGGDLAAVHATGIAVHNLVTSIERMAEIYRDAGLRARLDAKAIVARTLVAPETLLRQSPTVGSSLAGELAPGTLVLMATREAGQRTLDPRINFMHGSWSFCPAHRLVPALLAAVWQEAVEPTDSDEAGRKES